MPQRYSWGQKNIMLASHIDTSRENPAVSMWGYMNILAITMKTFKRCLTVLKDRRVKLCAEKLFRLNQGHKERR